MLPLVDHKVVPNGSKSNPTSVEDLMEVNTLKRFVFLSISLLILAVLIPGCVTFQTTTPNPVPPVAQPSVIGTFSSNPSTINSGGTSTLLWNVTGANSVSIDNGIGLVDAAGTRLVSPAASTVYTISATNSTGTVTRSSLTAVNSILVLTGDEIYQEPAILVPFPNRK